MKDPSVAYWGCSVVAWVAFGYKLRDLLRAPRNPMLWGVCTTLLIAGAAVFCAAPATVAAINRTSGVPNLAALVVYALLVALAASAHVLLAYWGSPSDRARQAARWWVAAYSLFIGALTVLFVVGETPVERRVDFDTYYATTPYIVEFILLYLLAVTAAMAALVRMCRKWAQVAGRPWLRRGLRLIVVGAVGALGFSVAKLAAVAARWCGADWDWLSSRLAPGLAMFALVVSAVGYALPVWGQNLTRLRSLVRRYRAYRDLYPLWHALRTATPAIVPPARLPWWDFELRLTRRLAEINDGRLALRSHIDPRAARTAARLGREGGLTGVDLYAVVEAARLKAAMAAKGEARKFPHAAAAAHEGPVGGTDGIGELAWLVNVSRTYAGSPIVAAAAAAAGAEGTAVGAEGTAAGTEGTAVGARVPMAVRGGDGPSAAGGACREHAAEQT